MKKRYTKCECCPYYAKDGETGKWQCSTINVRYYCGSELMKSNGLCAVFNYHTQNEKQLEIANQVLGRWINANKRKK